MPMTEKQFKEYLLLYGTEIDNWTEDLQAETLLVQRQHAFTEWMMEQQYYDEMLFNNRSFEVASPDLADRIIYSARAVKKSPSVTFSDMLRELLSFVLPQPAYAFAAVLMLGLVAGLYTPMPVRSANASDTILQAYTADEGSIL